MVNGPGALGSGQVLDGRYAVVRVLGRGGFGIVYEADDLRRGDLCVVKELAPEGSARKDGGLLQLPGDAPYRNRLRQQFQQEANNLSRLRHRGILPIRGCFTQNGTAYIVTDSVADSSTLESQIQNSGPMPAAKALQIGLELLDCLDAIHRAGLLHRDIKPSNILVSASGQPFFIDFGAAREWHADASSHQTVMFTPGYAPIEQLSQMGRRGPATDLYALCATLYHMLVGKPPPNAADRASGVPLVPLAGMRRDLDPEVVEAIESGLELQYEARPQSAMELAARIRGGVPKETMQGSLADFDRRSVELKRLRFQKRQCPGCGGVLEVVKPIRRGVCPVCREGQMKHRTIDERLCAGCRSGMLKALASPIPLCPHCEASPMKPKRVGVKNKHWVFSCLDCGLKLEEQRPERAIVGAEGTSVYRVGDERSFAEWIAETGRPGPIRICDSCGAQFDEMQDGRWQYANRHKGSEYEALYPDEWARVAAGLDPAAGNSECDACGAEFFVDGDQMTLLVSHRDPNGFAAEHQGRCLQLEDARWLASGKSSPVDGLVCEGCGMEFDTVGNQLRLSATSHERLTSSVGELHGIGDWHRIANGLPTESERAEFEERFDEALYQAYEKGEIDFGAKEGVVWKGHGSWFYETADGKERSGEGSVTIADGKAVFGRLLAKCVVDLKTVDDVGLDADDSICLSDTHGKVRFQVDPVTLRVGLDSGTRYLELSTQNLFERLRHSSRQR